MANQPNEGFKDNWAYLKAELGWLDRMLMMALSRYRQEKKEVDRVAQTKADKVSSHWWKGVISLDGKIAYDEHRPNAKISTGKTNSNSTSTSKSANPDAKSAKVTVSSPKPGYQQQLEAQLKISRNNGVVLALPWFRDRLKLSLFEKNLVIMALAPEVNRRYARLYRYLQSQDDNPVTDLPTVELVLRLLCRSDVEWRRARTAFHPEAPLMRHGLLMSLNDSHDPFLNATLRLSDDFVDYLLAETPDPILMEQLLAPSSSLAHRQPWPVSNPLPNQFPVEFSPERSLGTPTTLAPGGSLDAASSLASGQSGTNPETVAFEGTIVNAHTDASIAQDSTQSQDGIGQPTDPSTETSSTVIGQKATWDDLVVAPEVKASLQHLSHRLTLHTTVQQKWNTAQPSIQTIQPGLVMVFAGPSGTGKTLATRILAHDLACTVHCVNLAGVMDIDYFQLLDEIESLSPCVLLIQAAERWLSRAATLPHSRLTHFLAHRRKQVGLTVFSVEHGASVSQVWQQHIDQSVPFTGPTVDQRLTLWQRAFPPKTNVSVKVDWGILSQITLSGGDIEAIAHDALIRMIAEGTATLKIEHLVAALKWHHISDTTIQTFVDDCKLARKRALAAKAKMNASSAKRSSAKATKAKSVSKKSTPKKSTRKHPRRTKTSKTGVEDANLSDPLVPDETPSSPTADESNPELSPEIQPTSPIDSTVQTPTP